MINAIELEEIRGYLKKAENPMFFFDDDADGLCSFLLLNKYTEGRGYWVVVKSIPTLNAKYLNKVSEYNPDVIFLLDKPKLSRDFVDAVNVPIVWVDHHEPQRVKGVHYYNPRKENPDDGRCTTYWCYKIAEENPDDMWIATAGCVSDWQIPDFIGKFEEKYRLLEGKKKPNEILFETKFGKFCRILSFLLKGKTSDVRKRINALIKINGPSEILEKASERGKFLFREAEKVAKKYNELLKLCLAVEPRGKIHVFTYPSSELSLTADLSNELLHRFPDRTILIGREKNGFMKISLRSNHFILPPIVEKALDGVEGYGGGHEYACGGNIAVKDFEKFVARIEEMIR